MVDLFSWEILWGPALVLFAAAIAWGMFRYHTRNKANDALTEEATRKLREHGQEQYMNEDRPRLDRAARRR